MYLTHKAGLDLPYLPPAERRIHIVVPASQSHSLLSMGQLCDAGCEVVFAATTAHVCHDDRVFLTGEHSHLTGLWHLGLVNPPTVPTASTSTVASIPHHSFAAIASTTPADLVAFAHATLVSPVLSTSQNCTRPRVPAQLPRTHNPILVDKIPAHICIHDKWPSRPVTQESPVDQTPATRCNV